MESSKRTGRSWLKTGCAAVVVIAGLLLAWTLVVVGSAFVKSRLETVERRELARPFVAASESTPPIAADQSETVPSSGGGGRLVLVFDVGHFSIEPGAPGESIRVDAEYDTRSYALEGEFEEASDGGGWTYRVTFHEIGLLRDGGLRALLGGAFPRVSVYVPPDVPIAIESDFGKGFTEAELGGLWLTGIDLEAEKGAFALDISEPLAAPVNVVRLRTKQGGMKVRGVGNASPSMLEIDCSMGGADIDLRGLWLNDADVSIRSSMGGADILLPKNVRVEGLEGHGSIRAPRDDETPRFTLRMSVSSFMGGVDVRD